MGSRSSQKEKFFPHEHFLQLLKHTFGRKVELVDYTVANQHHDYLVLLVQLRHPFIKVVIKLAGPEASMICSFERTAMIHRLVGTHSTIPVPEILAVNISYQIWPWRYLIKTYVPGQELAVVRRQMNIEELSTAYQQIGNAVAQLHTIQFPTFGELAIDGGVQGEESFLPAFRKRVQQSIKKVHLRDLFFSALDNQLHLFEGVRYASLCHEDLHGHNILFQYRQGQWHLATILDFDKAWAGHHESDLARMEFWKGMTSNEFWRSYKAICSIDPLYKQRRPIYQLLWCLEYARPTLKHLVDTQRLCAELGIPSVEHFA